MRYKSSKIFEPGLHRDKYNKPNSLSLRTFHKAPTDLLFKESKRELCSKGSVAAHGRLTHIPWQDARISGVQNAGKLEFPPAFKNEMFVADVIWQRQKGKKPENPNA